MDRRTTKREARRRQLLDAAMAIVVEGGLDALTVAGIAHRLDAAVGSLYRYFPGKDALVMGLQERAIQDFHGFLAARLDVARGTLGAEAETPVGRLALLIVAFASYLEDAQADASRHRLIDTFLSSPTPTLPEAHARAVDAVLAPVLGTYSALLDDAVAAGVLHTGDAAVRTYVMWAAVHGLDHLRKRDRITPAPLHVDQVLGVTCGTVLRGWGASADEVTEAQARVAAMDLSGAIALTLASDDVTVDDEDDDELEVSAPAP